MFRSARNWISRVRVIQLRMRWRISKKRWKVSSKRPVRRKFKAGSSSGEAFLRLPVDQAVIGPDIVDVRHTSTPRAGWILVEAAYGVNSTQRAVGQGAAWSAPNVRADVIPGGHGVVSLVVFQSPLLLRRINLPEVIDACVGCRVKMGHAGPAEVKSIHRYTGNYCQSHQVSGELWR